MSTSDVRFDGNLSYHDNRTLALTNTVFSDLQLVFQRPEQAGEQRMRTTKSIRFRCNQIVPLGKRITLFVPWPVLLGGRVALQLVLEECLCTLEADGTYTAQVGRYEFRTRSKKMFAS
jgi:hypothetical protein